MLVSNRRKEIIETIYKVGVYMRLSREDEDKENESESITNQRAYILDYLKNNNFTVYDEYVDDGISGTTLVRVRLRYFLHCAVRGVCKICFRWVRPRWQSARQSYKRFQPCGCPFPSPAHGLEYGL